MIVCVALTVSCAQEDTARIDALMADGKAAMASGDFDGALLFYTLALDVDPGNRIALLDRGGVRLTRGDVDGSIADFSTAIDADPAASAGYINRGTAYAQSGQLELAVQDFDRAIGIDPEFSGTYLNRASARYALGDAEGAMEDYNRLLALSPDFTAAHYARGNIKYDSGDYAGALEDYALCWNRDYVALRTWMALARLDRRDEADRILVQFTGEDAPTDTTTAVHAAAIRFFRSEISEADFIAAINGAGLGDAAKASMHYYLGSKRLIDGDTAKAREHFASSVTLGGVGLSESLTARAELERLSDEPEG